MSIKDSLPQRFAFDEDTRAHVYSLMHKHFSRPLPRHCSKRVLYARSTLKRPERDFLPEKLVLELAASA